MALVLLAIAVRVVFIQFGQLPLESDEAIVGLMARHILYGGERPIFYYGQNYLGPLEPGTAAVIFAALGPSVAALRLAPALFSVVFLAFSTSYARRAFGVAAGVATAVYLAIPPLFLLTWSVKARGGYAELIALGSIVLYLSLDLGEAKAGPLWKWLCLGFVAGIAIWTHPLAVAYLVPSAAYLACRRRSRILSLETIASLASFVVASLPMLVANVVSRGATWRDLSAPNVSEPVTIVTYRHNLSATIRESVPTILGFYQASSNVPSFLASRSGGLWPSFGVSVAMGLLALVCGVLAIASLWRGVRGRPQPEDLLVWVGVCTVGLFCVSQMEAIYVTEPRYLLPLYALVPVAGGYWATLWKSRRSWAGAILVALVALNSSSIAAFVPSLAAPHLDGVVVYAGDPSLAALLEAEGVRAVYADYWLSYPIAFQSEERIVPSVVDERFQVGFNRYIPYAIAVDQNPQPAVIVVANSPASRLLRDRLQRSGRTYRVVHWKYLELFTQIAPALRPGRV